MIGGLVMVKIDKTLDIKGLVCPRPKALTMKTLENMVPGQVLMVVTSDRSTKQSIPSLCASRGYKVLALAEDGGTIYFTIQK